MEAIFKLRIIPGLKDPDLLNQRASELAKRWQITVSTNGVVPRYDQHLFHLIYFDDFDLKGIEEVTRDMFARHRSQEPIVLMKDPYKAAVSVYTRLKQVGYPSIWLVFSEKSLPRIVELVEEQNRKPAGLSLV